MTAQHLITKKYINTHWVHICDGSAKLLQTLIFTSETANNNSLIILSLIVPLHLWKTFLQLSSAKDIIFCKLKQLTPIILLIYFGLWLISLAHVIPVAGSLTLKNLKEVCSTNKLFCLIISLFQIDCISVQKMKTMWSIWEALCLSGRVLHLGAGPRIKICTGPKISCYVHSAQGQKYHVMHVVHLGKALYPHLLHSTQVN